MVPLNATSTCRPQVLCRVRFEAEITTDSKVIPTLVPAASP